MALRTISDEQLQDAGCTREVLRVVRDSINGSEVEGFAVWNMISDYAKRLYIKSAEEKAIIADTKARTLRMNPEQIDHTAYPWALRKMSDADILFTIKDANEALAAHPKNPKAGYYADEINYCAAEMKRRIDESKKSRKNPKRKESYRTIELKMPAYWASYLVNDDASGLEKKEKDLADAYLQSFGKTYKSFHVVNVSEETSFGRSDVPNAMLGDNAIFTIHATPR